MRMCGAILTTLMAYAMAFLPAPLRAQTIDSIVEACLTEAASIQALTGALEEQGLHLLDGQFAIEIASNFFAIPLLAENVPIDSSEFNWAQELTILSKQLNRVLSRGQTDKTKFSYFSVDANTETAELLVIRSTVPGLKNETQCRLVSFTKNWPESTLVDTFASAISTNTHSAGFQHGIIRYQAEDSYKSNYASLSIMDASLLSDVIGTAPLETPSIVATFVSKVTPDLKEIKRQ